jgi:DNA repair exonuclease SbcCD ATPase subunit
LLLDEPTNDLDTDMLAALEDVLDSWPGTLIVVSHDRYLLERVTDQQYAVLNGHLRHLPGGIDEYLRLDSATVDVVAPVRAAAPASTLSGADRHQLEKDIKSLNRQIENLRNTVATLHTEFAAHDQSDYEGLTALSEKMRASTENLDSLEVRWLEATGKLDG